MSSEKTESGLELNSKLLARGEMALKAIQLRKKAAEFEAVAAELEAAVELAKQGQDRQLFNWMERYGHGQYAQLGESLSKPLEGIATSVIASSVATTTDLIAASMPLAHSSTPIQSTAPWSEMLAGVEARSFAGSPRTSEPFGVELDHAKSASSDSKSEKAKPDSQLTEKPVIDCVQKLAPNEIAKKVISKTGKPLTSKSKVERKANPSVTAGNSKPSQVNKNDGNRRNAILKAALDDETKRKKPQFRWAWLGSSWGSSLVVHILMVLGLFLITIQMTENKAMSISSASVEGPQALMEEPMEFDPTIPEELSEEMPAEAMPQLSTLTTTSVSTALPESVVGELSLPQPEATAGSAVAKMVNVTGASSKLANVQFFGVQAEGNTFCYVVDSSGSMKRDGAFDAAKSELMRSLASMKPTQRFFVYFFSEEVDALTLDGKEPEKYPVYATPENIQKTLAWVQRIQIRGGKPPNDALDQAIEMDPDGIFLLFDGDTKVDVPAHLQKSNRSFDIISGTSVRVPIHTIGFYTQKYEVLLKRIAEENSGTYRFVPKPLGKK
jgi:von Willebrand factor type A domain